MSQGPAPATEPPPQAAAGYTLPVTVTDPISESTEALPDLPKEAMLHGRRRTWFRPAPWRLPDSLLVLLAACWLALAADPSALPFTPFSHDHVVVAEVLADLDAGFRASKQA